MTKKFFNVNLTYISEHSEEFNLTGKQLKGIVLLLQNITFADDDNAYGGNIIKITKDTKDIISSATSTEDGFFRQLISQLTKSKIIRKVAKNVYKVNDDIIDRGYLKDTNWKDVKFIKVNANDIFYKIKKWEDLSALEVSILFNILNTIDTNTNGFPFDKAVRTNTAIKYNCSEKTISRFYNKLKDMDLFIKINNKMSKINDSYLSCMKYSDVEKKDTPDVVAGINLAEAKAMKSTDFLKVLKFNNENLAAVADERIITEPNTIIDLFEYSDARYVQ